MVKLEFGIVHEGCLVNELSRALPEVRLICPGGFVLSPSSVEEIIIIDQASEEKIEVVLDHLHGMAGIAEAELLEHSGDRAFIRILTAVNPDTGFCSEAVARNRGYRIGMEIQDGGLEIWKVAFVRASDAQQLLQDLESMGQIKCHTISEVSWQALLEGDDA